VFDVAGDGTEEELCSMSPFGQEGTFTTGLLTADRCPTAAVQDEIPGLTVGVRPSKSVSSAAILLA
jgi:hypothetical protein